jgi:hypothetical protein
MKVFRGCIFVVFLYTGSLNNVEDSLNGKLHLIDVHDEKVETYY